MRDRFPEREKTAEIYTPRNVAMRWFDNALFEVSYPTIPGEETYPPPYFLRRIVRIKRTLSNLFRGWKRTGEVWQPTNRELFQIVREDGRPDWPFGRSILILEEREAAEQFERDAKSRLKDGPGKYLAIGVNKETGDDAELVVAAKSKANAKVKAELKGLVVTDMRWESELAEEPRRPLAKKTKPPDAAAE